MDTAVFYVIQRLTGRSSVLDNAGIYCASVLIWVEAFLIIVFLLLDRRRRIWAFAAAAASAFLAWLVADGIGWLYFRPRPFAVLANVRLLISKSALDKSFPSDHASIAFAAATAIYLVDRRWGAPLLAIAALIALGRVFVGVHYPSDVVVGALLGGLCAYAIHRLIHNFLHTRHRLGKKL